MVIGKLIMTEYEKSASNRISGYRYNREIGRSGLAAWFFKPVLAPILRDRGVLILLATLAVIQVGLTAAGWHAWQCPIYSLSGLPCPGCGLSRATVLLVQGQWSAAIHMHAFAPIALAAITGIAIAGLLPRKQLQSTLMRIAAVERRTGIVVVLSLALIIYWGLRVFGVIGYV